MPLPDSLDAAPDLNAAIATDVHADTIPPDLTDARDYPRGVALEENPPRSKRTLRRLTDGEVSRLYRAWLDVDADAAQRFVDAGRTYTSEVRRRVRRTFAVANGLTMDQARAIERRGKDLLEVAALATAAVHTSPKQDAEYLAPSARETRTGGPDDVREKGAGVSASPRPAIDGMPIGIGGSRSIRVSALAKMLDQLRPAERDLLRRRLGAQYHEAIDDARGVDALDERPSAIASATDLASASEATRAQERLSAQVALAAVKLDAYRVRDAAGGTMETVLPLVRGVALAIPDDYAGERTRIVGALDLLREVLGMLGVL